MLPAGPITALEQHSTLPGVPFSWPAGCGAHVLPADMRCLLARCLAAPAIVGQSAAHSVLSCPVQVSMLGMLSADMPSAAAVSAFASR